MDEVSPVILGTVNAFGGLLFGYQVGIFADMLPLLTKLEVIDARGHIHTHKPTH
jgi:hypothetical protein